MAFKLLRRSSRAAALALCFVVVSSPVRAQVQKPGEKRSVSFTIEPRQLAVIGDDGRAVVEPGEFRVSVGGKQPGLAGTADAATTSLVEGRFTVVGAATEVKR